MWHLNSGSRNFFVIILGHVTWPNVYLLAFWICYMDKGKIRAFQEPGISFIWIGRQHKCYHQIFIHLCKAFNLEYVSPIAMKVICIHAMKGFVCFHTNTFSLWKRPTVLEPFMFNKSLYQSSYVLCRIGSDRSCTQNNFSKCSWKCVCFVCFLILTTWSIARWFSKCSEYISSHIWFISGFL